jgi:hypothetical protein
VVVVGLVCSLVFSLVFWLAGEISLGVLVAEGARPGAHCVARVLLWVWQALPQTRLPLALATSAVPNGRATIARSDGDAATIRNYTSEKPKVISYFFLKILVDCFAVGLFAGPHTLGYVFGQKLVVFLGESDSGLLDRVPAASRRRRGSWPSWCCSFW